MPNYTKNYHLIKPVKTELYNVDDVTNSNADIIDNELAKRINKVDNCTENNIPIICKDGNIKDSGMNLINISNSFMATELPDPSETYNNICYMYIGESNGELETNNFYKCILDKTTKQYEWTKVTLAGLNHIPVETVADIPNIQYLSDES